MFAYTVTPRSINLLLDGRMRTVEESHINFTQIRSLLQRDGHGACIPALRDLVDVKRFIAKYTEGKLAVGEDDTVYYAGAPIHTYAAERLVELLRNKFDIAPLAKFIDRLMTNPDTDVHQDLFKWLESGHMPMTGDGCFLAFKKVDPNYKSYHQSPDGTHLDHSIGSTVSEPREEVDKNRYSTCSRGLHFCSYSYLGSYEGREGHVVILKIAPEDVCAIPHDYHDTKGRAWKYDVVGEVAHEEAKQFFDEKTPIVSTYDPPAAQEPIEAEGRYDEETWDTLQDDADTAIAQEEMKAAEEAAKPKPKPGKIVIGDEAFTPKQLQKAVKVHGQRGFAAMYGVARSTLQGWLKKTK